MKFCGALIMPEQLLCERPAGHDGEHCRSVQEPRTVYREHPGYSIEPTERGTLVDKKV